MRKNVFQTYVILLLILFIDRSLVAGEWHTVNRVQDGDTIVLANGKHVRYIGINAPEVDHEKQKAEPYGNIAKIYNQKLVLSKNVRLEFDKERYDRYGRLLAYVFLQGEIFVNKALVDAGYAYCLPRKPNIRYGYVLIRSQRNAMSTERGIWRNWKEKEVGFWGSSQSKRFHRKKCRFGKRINKKNRIFFSSKWDAFWAGYAPCKRCIDGYSVGTVEKRSLFSYPGAWLLNAKAVSLAR